MDQFRIYTAGKMSGLSPKEQSEWRDQIENEIKWLFDYRGIPCSKVKFIHPPEFYSYEFPCHQSELEIKNWELNQVRNSDVVIVNLNEIESSIGTHYELATADAVNSFGNKHIFVIGIGDKEIKLHPWIEATLHRREERYEDAARYIVDYLLV